MAYRPTAATEATRTERIAVLRATARALVAEKGFAAASIRAIADRAGLSVGSVYTYFSSRADLLVHVFRDGASAELEVVRAAVRAAADGPVDGRAQRQLRAVAHVFGRRAAHNRRLAWALLAEPVGEAIDAERAIFRDAYADLFGTIIAGGIAAGYLPPQDVDIVAHGLVGLIAEAFIGPLTPAAEPAAPVDDVIDAISVMVLRAVGATG